MGKYQSFSAMLFLVAAFAVASGQCVDPYYQPGKTIIMGHNETVCDEAVKCGLDCSVLAKCLVMFQHKKIADPNAYDTLTFYVPWPYQVKAAEKELGYRQTPKDTVCPLKAQAKKKPVKLAGKKASRPIVCPDGETPARAGQMPFHVEDYKRCRYDVSEADQANRKTLRQLARDFHSPAIRLAFFNDMPADALLSARQQIVIPDWDYTYWRYINRLPFGNRDPHKLWPKLKCFKEHPELIQVLAAKYANNEFKPSSVQSGQMFDQWTSGNYIICDNGVAAFPADTFVTAKRYDIDIPGTDSFYVVKDPDRCNNWLYRKVSRLELEDTLFTPPPPPPPPPEHDTVVLVKENTPVCPPTDTVKQTDTLVWEPFPSSPIINNRDDFWVSDARPEVAKRFAFDRQGAQAYGLKWDLFWQNSRTRNGLGLTVMGDGYDGESRSGFHYYGGEGCIGPMAIISFSPIVYWGLDLCVGAQANRGLGSLNYHYDSYATNGYLSHGETFDAMPPTLHLSMWGTAKWAFDPQKQSVKEGIHTVQSGTSNPDSLDQVDDNSGIDGGVRLYFLHGISSVEPFVVYRSAYALCDNSRSNSLGIGIAFWNETLMLEASYLNRSASKWQDNNGNSLLFLVNLSFGRGRGNPAAPKSNPTPVISGSADSQW